MPRYEIEVTLRGELYSTEPIEALTEWVDALYARNVDLEFEVVQTRVRKDRDYDRREA